MIQAPRLLAGSAAPCTPLATAFPCRRPWLPTAHLRGSFVSAKRGNTRLLIIRPLPALLLLAVAFWASWSQQPIPARSETCQNEQQQTAGPNQPIGENKASQPPSIIVNVLPRQETETEKSRKRKERHDKVSLEPWSIESTVAIAFFTGVLALLTILLWLDTRKSRKTAAKPADVAEKAVGATTELERRQEP